MSKPEGKSKNTNKNISLKKVSANFQPYITDSEENF
jgi:hypothetical protein